MTEIRAADVRELRDQARAGMRTAEGAETATRECRSTTRAVHQRLSCSRHQRPGADCPQLANVGRRGSRSSNASHENLLGVRPPVHLALAAGGRGGAGAPSRRPGRGRPVRRARGPRDHPPLPAPTWSRAPSAGALRLAASSQRSRPSSTASATIAVSSRMARIASSLPGIGYDQVRGRRSCR